MNKKVKYSVVIPTYNSEEFLHNCIESVRKAFDNIEIIIIDGGSSDRTQDISLSQDVIFENGCKGRGYQLNQGGKKSSGDIILFLHADTLLPSNAWSIIQNQFTHPSIKIATFKLKFDKNHWLLNYYGFMSGLDSLWTTFGDQCIVVRKDFYERLGGFPNWPLFEDVEFLRNARKQQKIISLNAEVITSSQKYVSNGIFRQQIKNGWFIYQYLLGVSPEKLSSQYNR